MLLCVLQRLKWLQKRSWSNFLLWLYVTAWREKSLMGVWEQPCPHWALAELRSSIFVSCVILGMRMNLAPGRAGVNSCQPSGKFSADHLLLLVHRIIWAGKDLQDHRDQPLTITPLSTTPEHWVPHLVFPWIPSGMGIPPPPWTAPSTD